MKRNRECESDRVSHVYATVNDVQVHLWVTRFDLGIRIASCILVVFSLFVTASNWWLWGSPVTI